MSKVAIPLLKQYLTYMRSGQGFDKILKNVNIISANDGFCKAQLTIQPDQANVFGYLHGGFSATLVDVISGIALLSHKREFGGVSVNINLSFLKAAQVGEEITVEARTLKRGKNLGFLEVEIKNKEGDLLVSGTQTKFIG